MTAYFETFLTIVILNRLTSSNENVEQSLQDLIVVAVAASYLTKSDKQNIADLLEKRSHERRMSTDVSNIMATLTNF